MATAPIEFPPPVDSAQEFVGPPTDPEDERIEVGVAIVGGGPGGLACAIRLTHLLAEDEALIESLGEVPVALVEKGKSPGSHLLSGAMMNPSAMRKLFPDLDESEWPTYGAVDNDAVYLLPNSKRAIPLKPTPPPFRNHGNHVTSVAQLGRWLSQQAEEAGVYILGETSGHKLLVEDGRTVGVRSGDKGRGRGGEELSNFEPGADLIAKATVLAEGTAGHLTGAAIRHFGIGSEDPQQWELGVKEIWEVEQPLDRVIHTMGWPLHFAAKYREFGGSFMYPMGEDRVSLGFVVGLDYRDARFSVHDALQQMKQHPLFAKRLEGGKRVGWGAKTIPSGGYWARPRRLWAPGLALVGDGVGMVNVPTLKGVHYAMHAGMFAAEAIFERLKSGSGAGVADLSNYQDKVEGSEIQKDTYRSRNMRQPFAKGFLVGPDGKTTFDKLSSVFATGNATRDDAPNHIRIQDTVPLEVALMWQNMCPAQVYEVPDEELEAAKAAGNGKLDGKREVKLQITPSNCVQCGAITAKGGRLTPPEGGDGPNYQVT
jgi:electron-transferring-flavoprotein dehydrogenase